MYQESKRRRTSKRRRREREETRSKLMLYFYYFFDCFNHKDYHHRGYLFIKRKIEENMRLKCVDWLNVKTDVLKIIDCVKIKSDHRHVEIKRSRLLRCNSYM